MLRVLDKVRRERVLPMGNKTVKALDRYLRKRSQHSAARSTALWPGHKGQMGDSGIAQVIRRRGREAGLGDNLHPTTVASHLRPTPGSPRVDRKAT